MLSWDEVEKGDVVTFERTAVIEYKSNTGADLKDVLGYGVQGVKFGEARLLSVEKPHTRFKAGDVVKHLTSGSVFTLGEGRLFDHQDHRWYSQHEWWFDRYMTSEHYELA